ncbi:MAG: aryl-sulfate sulfotransferase [Dehalococcoidales bacterium]|nr:aryl-sulfate sulfotransferase [Dehalococcoidales bacterium]
MKPYKFSRKRLFMLVISKILIILVAGFSILTAIPGNAIAQTPLPTYLPDVTATVDRENSLIARIEGSVEAPGEVMVEYWSQGGASFITGPSPAEGGNFSIQIMRLRAETDYHFKVFLRQLDGTSPVLQHQGTFQTGPLPEGLRDARFDLVQGKPTNDLTLLDFNDDDFTGIVAIDQDAEVVWYFEHDRRVFTMAQDEDYNLVFNELGDVEGWAMNKIAPDGELLNSVRDIMGDGTTCEPHGRWHHEVFLRPDNKVWTLGSEIRTVNINGEDRLKTGDTIEEWDIDAGRVTRLVSFFDIMDPAGERTEFSDTTGGFFWRGCDNEYEGQAEDWTHSNSLDVTADGNILVSHRHLNQVSAIKPDFSGIAWRLGGPESDFTFPNPSDRFYHQHTAKALPNGNILLFDNGNFRPESEGGQYSRGLELELNFDTMEARKVWEYRHTPDLFAGAVCSVYRLDNGNTIVDFGYDDVNDPDVFTLVESDPEGNAVAVIKISSVGKTIQYRAIPLDSINGEIRGSN